MTLRTRLFGSGGTGTAVRPPRHTPGDEFVNGLTRVLDPLIPILDALEAPGPGGGVEEEATEDRDPLPPAPRIANQDPRELFIPVSNPAPGLHEIVSGGRPVPPYAELRARYAVPDSPEVDFRAMLNDDDQAWSTKTRLEAVLGRPYLSTKLVDQLDPETAATLADRLEVFVRDAVAEATAQINRDIACAVSAKVEEYRGLTDRAREVSRERFGRPSRLN